MQLQLDNIGDTQVIYRYRRYNSVPPAFGWGEWIFCDAEKYCEISAYIKYNEGGFGAADKNRLEAEKLVVTLEHRNTCIRPYHPVTNILHDPILEYRNYAARKKETEKAMAAEFEKNKEPKLPQYDTLHDRLMFLRGNITFKTIADDLKISTSQLRRIFHGTVTPKADDIDRMAVYFGVPRDYLTGATNG